MPSPQHNRHVQSSGFRPAIAGKFLGLVLGGLLFGAVSLSAQRTKGAAKASVKAPATASAKTVAHASVPLVLDGVTVIDVQNGTRVTAQRVVVVGNRIKRIGSAATTAIPTGARVVDARGKYLIPGLWDMHVHPFGDVGVYYPLFIANGITGIRDAGSPIPLDTQRQWRGEILAGTRVGPPRQMLSGKALDAGNPSNPCVVRKDAFVHHLCVDNQAEARKVVDSLQVAGADIIKTYDLTGELYFAIAREAKRVGLPFGGHLQQSAIDASDSGALFLDHLQTSGDVGERCFGPNASVARCQPVADHFRKNNSWFVPTLVVYPTGLSSALSFPLESVGTAIGFPKLYGPLSQSILGHLFAASRSFLEGRTADHNWLGDSVQSSEHADTDPSAFAIARRVALPMVSGTDVTNDVRAVMLPGFGLHAELALLVAEGVTPLEALQMATLNPAMALRSTDSLGTIAAGKLADLVVLEADPLTNIANTSRLWGVVANGRYFDRAQLDELLAQAQVKVTHP